ncbi:alpha/beta fold hydrolase [Plantactinospora sp. KBS50]|uniref:alpha/beta fold hydrolase n=1 Tax=Plantactinospora sp. KBS50 TaxID=2024580 RepID=UPI000BAB123B|nr:alpha/beta hydrolase [Plantactinospora sp. KBS50]ASW55461.1 alpha/beta hydrolase [Plantactinospora sp. KBS50]
MPMIDLDGVRLSYADSGHGPAVLLIAGSGAPGRTWHLHQVPALCAAGFRVVTYDNRGVAPSDVPEQVRLADLVADAVGLIGRLGLGPCRVVGSSMGARVAAELCRERPELVDRAVLMATFARPSAFLSAMSAAERVRAASGVALPDEYRAMVRAAVNLSPRTIADDRRAQDWLDVFQLSPAEEDDGRPGRLVDGDTEDRTGAYGAIATPCLVLGFADDLVAPARGCREVAAAIPGARYVQIPDAGHYGYLEQPGPVNTALIDYLTTEDPA